MRNKFKQLKRRLYYRYSNIKEGISNLVKWAPIVWRDRDWDHHYFFETVKFKLEKMEKFFNSKNCISVGCEDDAKKTRKCIILVDRIMKDDYYENAEGVKEWVIHGDYMKRQDVEYLFHLLNKYILTWWD